MDTAADSALPDKRSRNISGAIRGYGKKLFGFIRGRVRSDEDAEDLLQDVWFQLSNFSGAEELENMSAWLYRVARNRITDYYRKKKSTSLEDLAYENEDGGFSFRELLMPDESDPDLAEFRELFWEELTRALDELPEKQKKVFVLNELEDMTLQAIADQEGENLKTIISRKLYAVRHLRQRLQYLYNELSQ